MSSIEHHLSPVWKNRQFSNFGTVFDNCVERLSEIMGGRALPVTSGTTAIQVALAFLGMRGKRVGLPDYTHTGTLLAVIGAGAIPVLFGVDTKKWTTDPNTVKDVDCFIAVSPFGYALEMEKWEALPIPVVYDLAGAFGFFPQTKNIRCYSFHSTKNFGVGEGGCLVLPNQEAWEDCKRITNFGTMPNRHIQNMEGLNAKIDELKAASLLALCEEEQLTRCWRRIQNKQATLSLYQKELAYCGVFVPSGPKKPSLCVLGNLPAEQLEIEGHKKGIICKQYYPLLSRMTALEDVERKSRSPDMMNNCIALPSDVSIGEAFRVLDFVHEIVEVMHWNS